MLCSVERLSRAGKALSFSNEEGKEGGKKKEGSAWWDWNGGGRKGIRML